MYIYIYMYICIYIYIYVCTCVAPHIWLRTNGVNTNGAAAEVMKFDRLRKRYALAVLGRNDNYVNGSTQKVSLSNNMRSASTPLVLTPCPFPNNS